jgi:hypothetical protein
MKCTRKQVRGNTLELYTMSFESVQSFKYLGSTVNRNNTIEEEIKRRIIAGNKTFRANQKKILQSKSLSRIQIEIAWNIKIRPILTYASETWVLNKIVYRNS